MEKHMTETKRALNKHSEDMGKATKAMNGDMLKVKESMFALKQEVMDKIEEMKNFAAYLERETRAMAQALELTTEKLDEKFGRIIEIKKELEMLNGKVIRVEENQGKFHIEIIKTKERLEAAGRLLQNQQEEISRIKKGRQQ